MKPLLHQKKIQLLDKILDFLEPLILRAMGQIARSPCGLWLWRHGGMSLFGALLYLYGHAFQWAERHQYIKTHGNTPILQRAIAVLSLGFGLIYLFVGAGQTGSPILSALDDWLGPWLYHALPAAPVPVLHWHLRSLVPHQIVAVPLVISSVLLVIAVYEWPTGKDFDKAAKEQSGLVRDMDSLRLSKLFLMMRIGHLAGELYWLMFVTAALPGWHSHLAAIWFGSGLVAIHYSLYLHVMGDYETQIAQSVRVRLGLLAKAVPASLPGQ